MTLIDAMDTLVVMGNYSEFRRAVKLVAVYYKSFDIDVNVSVFETTIRILGGLISSHLFSVDPLLNIYVSYKQYFHVYRIDVSRLDFSCRRMKIQRYMTDVC